MNYDFSQTKLSKNKFPQDDGLVGTIEFRNLVQFIKGDKKRNFTINIPDIIEYKDAPKQTLPTLTYKERVIEYISKHRNHPILEKIHSMQQLTHADILALEQIC